MITERHVQAVWYDASLRPKILWTRRGSYVTVISPGEWNLGPGPDFLGAILEIGKDRRCVVGDVEVHLYPSDWDVHKHGADPRYSNVIAHVTWGCGPTPRSLPCGALSIWLGRFVMSDTSFTPNQIDLGAYPYARLPLGERPCKERLEGNPDKARGVLAMAGRRRLKMKARRLEGILAEVKECWREQIFYEELMTSFGYAKNAEAFRNIAKRIPLEELPLEAQVLKTAYLVAGEFERWDRCGMRPNNSPVVRLGHAAEIMTETSVLKLRDAGDFSREGCMAMVRELCGGERRFMGKGRAAAVIANVIVPFAMAEERIVEVPEWLPPEDVSAPVRLTAWRMFGRDHNPAVWYGDNGLLIQGLIEIHRECCLKHHPNCGGCGIGEGPGDIMRGLFS